MLKVSPDGWLYKTDCAKTPEITHVKSPRSYSLHTESPIGIVWHYTATAPNTGAAIARNWSRYNRDTDRAASAHVIIDTNGDIYQSVSLLRGAWHVGRRGRVAGRSWKNINRCTIGVEIVNPGQLREKGHPPEIYRYPWHDEHRLRVDRVNAHQCANGDLFHTYNSVQVDVARQLHSALTDAYHIKHADSNLKHSDFNSNKADPGPLWPEF